MLSRGESSAAGLALAYFRPLRKRRRRPASGDQSARSGLLHCVLDAAIATPRHCDWTTENAALLKGAAAEACIGILTSGIVHPTVHAAFAEVLPIEVLQDDLSV